jgi:hypothetical protein
LGALLGLAALARIDLMFVAAWVGLLLLWDARTGRRRPEAVALQLLLIGLGFAVVYAPWAVYSWRYTGAIYPISGSAVRFMSLANVGHDPDVKFFLHIGRVAVQSVFVGGLLLWVLAVAACAPALGAATSDRGQLARWRDDLRWLRLPLLFAPTLMAAYVFYMPGAWFFERYLFPWAVLAVLLLAVGLGRLQSNWPRVRSGAAAFVLTAAVLITGVALPEQRDLLTGSHDPNLGYRHLGLWARDNFQRGMVIGSSQTGALAYYATDLEVVNMDGVVDAEAFASLQEFRHMEWIEERGIRFVIGWTINFKFLLEHSRPDAQRKLRLVGKVNGLRSWGNEWLVYQVGARRTGTQP